MNIYRYKLSEYLLNSVQESFLNEPIPGPYKAVNELFAFKCFWNNWKMNHSHIINKEVETLKMKGYDKDPIEKIDKSIVYYHRCKIGAKIGAKMVSNNELNDGKPTTIIGYNKGKKYIKISKRFMTFVLNHIQIDLKNRRLKPSKAYDDFIVKYASDIKDEVYKLEQSKLSKEYIENKIKKTYKNQYFLHKN